MKFTSWRMNWAALSPGGGAAGDLADRPGALAGGTEGGCVGAAAKAGGALRCQAHMPGGPTPAPPARQGGDIKTLPLRRPPVDPGPDGNRSEIERAGKSAAFAGGDG